ncbi:MAG: hypothetical protein VKJ09_09275 [Leptolyngbya sp.]|nr:hypothetical protein [Leptolyngbya sp.]
MVRIRTKTCDRCGCEATVLYRVKTEASGPWHFLCDRCWPQLDSHSPHYRYGGTWKAKKRH